MMRTLFSISLAGLAASLLSLAPRTALAGEDLANGVPPTGKGITGGVLLGGEVVMLTEAAFKTKPAWAYAIGGLAGGVAGGVGGYFVEKGAGDGDKLPMYMLAGGMALIIPTTVAVLSASAYEPPSDYTEDKGPSDEPVAEPAHTSPAPASAAPPSPAPETPAAAPDAAPPPPPPAPAAPEGKRTLKVHHRVAKAPPTLYAPPALIGVGGRQVSLGVPGVEIRQVYSRADIMKYGVSQATEVRVPVVNFLF